MKDFCVMAQPQSKPGTEHLFNKVWNGSRWVGDWKKAAEYTRAEAEQLLNKVPSPGTDYYPPEVGTLAPGDFPLW